MPGQGPPAYGAGPNSIAVDANNGVAYVALYNPNAIAVVNLSGGATQSVMGLMSVAPLASPRSLFQAQIYTPSFTIPI